MSMSSLPDGTQVLFNGTDYAINGTEPSINPLIWEIPRASFHLLSVAANCHTIVRFWNQEPRFPNCMIRTMNGCFIVIGSLGITELLRDIHQLEFANGIVVLIVTVVIPRALTFVAWHSFLSVQLFVLRFTNNATNAQRDNRPSIIALHILGNVASSFVMFTAYSFILYNMEGTSVLVAVVVPSIYVSCGFLMSFFGDTKIEEKFTPVVKLNDETILETTPNVISAFRLYQRAAILVNVLMIIVFMIMCAMPINTVMASFVGVIIALFLTFSLAAQQKSCRRRDAVKDANQKEKEKEEKDKRKRVDHFDAIGGEAIEMEDRKKGRGKGKVRPGTACSLPLEANARKY